MRSPHPHHDDEPTATDLAAIEAEWPVIEAELELVDAEIRLLCAEGVPTELDWRRVRRAEAHVVREVAALAARVGTDTWTEIA